MKKILIVVVIQTPVGNTTDLGGGTAVSRTVGGGHFVLG